MMRFFDGKSDAELDKFVATIAQKIMECGHLAIRMMGPEVNYQFYAPQHGEGYIFKNPDLLRNLIVILENGRCLMLHFKGGNGEHWVSIVPAGDDMFLIVDAYQKLHPGEIRGPFNKKQISDALGLIGSDKLGERGMGRRALFGDIDLKRPINEYKVEGYYAADYDDAIHKRFKDIWGKKKAANEFRRASEFREAARPDDDFIRRAFSFNDPNEFECRGGAGLRPLDGKPMGDVGPKVAPEPDVGPRAHRVNEQEPISCPKGDLGPEVEMISRSKEWAALKGFMGAAIVHLSLSFIKEYFFSDNTQSTYEKVEMMALGSIFSGAGAGTYCWLGETFGYGAVGLRVGVAGALVTVALETIYSAVNYYRGKQSIVALRKSFANSSAGAAAGLLGVCGAVAVFGSGPAGWLAYSGYCVGIFGVGMLAGYGGACAGAAIDNGIWKAEIDQIIDIYEFFGFTIYRSDVRKNILPRITEDELWKAYNDRVDWKLNVGEWVEACNSYLFAVMRLMHPEYVEYLKKLFLASKESEERIKKMITIDSCDGSKNLVEKLAMTLYTEICEDEASMKASQLKEAIVQMGGDPAGLLNVTIHQRILLRLFGPDRYTGKGGTAGLVSSTCLWRCLKQLEAILMRPLARSGQPNTLEEIDFTSLHFSRSSVRLPSLAQTAAAAQRCMSCLAALAPC